MQDYITTYTKKHFTIMEPKMADIDINDIAHALSLMTRANGHFSQFYSVGQHSVGCAYEALERGYSARVVWAVCSMMAVRLIWLTSPDPSSST